MTGPPTTDGEFSFFLHEGRPSRQQTDSSDLGAVPENALYQAVHDMVQHGGAGPGLINIAQPQENHHGANYDVAPPVPADTSDGASDSSLEPPRRAFETRTWRRQTNSGRTTFESFVDENDFGHTSIICMRI